MPTPSARVANREASTTSEAGCPGSTLSASSATVVPSAPLVSDASGGCTG